MRIATKEEVMRVISHPEIWPLIIGNYDITPEQFKIPDTWETMTETGKEALILDIDKYIHPNFLPEVKGKAFFVIKKWIELVINKHKKIYARVPNKRENLIILLKYLGFEFVKSDDEKTNFVKRARLCPR